MGTEILDNALEGGPEGEARERPVKVAQAACLLRAAAKRVPRRRGSKNKNRGPLTGTAACLNVQAEKSRYWISADPAPLTSTSPGLSRTSMTTRRFLARPSFVALEATG